MSRDGSNDVSMKAAISNLGLRFLGSGCALFADRILGEPPGAVHPVIFFGRLMEKYEFFAWRDSRAAGVGYSSLGIATAAVSALLLDSPLLGTFVSTYLAVAERALLQNASMIEAKLQIGDLATAKELLPSLVGRDVSGLDSSACARAVVESVAENCSDAVVAPMIYGALFGAMGSLVYRAINTMDAMVGYRSDLYKNFGWASARIDDLVNFIPSRFLALMTAVNPTGPKVDLRAALCDGSKHPSPNAGMVESFYAHKLEITLGGSNSYLGVIEERTLMGRGRAVASDDITRVSKLTKSNDTLVGLSFIAAGLLLFGFGRAAR